MDTQDDLGFRCPYMPEDMFSYDAARILFAWDFQYKIMRFVDLNDIDNDTSKSIDLFNRGQSIASNNFTRQCFRFILY